MGLGISDCLFWLILAVGLLIVEAVTVNLVSIWFAIGSFCAAAAAWFRLGRISQVFLMLAVSGLIFWIYWHFRSRVSLRSDQILPTNADRIVGQEGTVLEMIRSHPIQGTIQVLGQTWSAVSETGDEIPEGTLVRVLELRGVRAVVRPLD